MLKNKSIIIFLMAILAMPVIAENEDVQEQTPDVIPAVTSPAVENTINYKQPVSKRRIAKKFLLAMGGVLASSLLLYFSLSLYNRIRFGKNEPAGFGDDLTSLKTPEDLSGAIRTFIEKTDWKN